MANKRTVTMFLAALLLFASGSVAQASSSDQTTATTNFVTPYYDYISVVGASLTIGSTGKAVSGGNVVYTGNYDSTITVKLQRSDGTGWLTVKSWTKSFTGSGLHSIEEEYYVTSGHTYRVVTSASVLSGSTVLETATSTSSEVTY